MIHRTREIGIRERNAPMRVVAQDVARGGPAVRPKEKAGLRIHVRMAPAVQDYSGDVAPRVEAAWREHVAELLAKRALVLRERRAEQLRSTPAALLADGQARLREQDFDGEDGRRIRTERGTDAADRRELSHRKRVAESRGPVAPGHPHH